MNNNLILDINEGILILNIFKENFDIFNTPMFKLKLKRYTNKNVSSEGKLVFNKNLKYIDFQKIIKVLELNKNKNGYELSISQELEKYIEQKNLYIRERSRVGLALKMQSDEFLSIYEEYKKILSKQMVRKLREKQIWDSLYMCLMKKCSNFSVPGSGKTSSVLGVYAYLDYKKQVDKVVVICPKNAFLSWKTEFELCFGEKKYLNVFDIQNYKKNKRNFALQYDSANKNLFLINYEVIEKVEEELIKIVSQNTLLVFDEVHKIKLIEGKRSIAAINVAKNAKYVIAMTGTPIPNSYLDIKNLLQLLYYDEYDDFFGFTEKDLKCPEPSDVEQINNKLQPFFCRTSKEQLGVTKANNDILIKVNATKEENKIFNILLLKYKKNKLLLIIRLLQLQSNPKMLLKPIFENGEDFSEILDTSKDIEDIEYKDYTQEIISLIDKVDKTSKFKKCIDETKKIVNQDKQVIIWCIFTDSINRIYKELLQNGIKCDYIYGETNHKKRDFVINNFINKQINVLITNPHTLAESISLHKNCHDAIYFEYSYNLVHLLQSKDRIHRLGLPNNQYTQYYYLQNEFTTSDKKIYSLDDVIYNRLLEKEKIMLDAIENDILEIVPTSEEDLNLIFEDLKF